MDIKSSDWTFGRRCWHWVLLLKYTLEFCKDFWRLAKNTLPCAPDLQFDLTSLTIGLS